MAESILFTCALKEAENAEVEYKYTPFCGKRIIIKAAKKALKTTITRQARLFLHSKKTANLFKMKTCF